MERNMKKIIKFVVASIFSLFLSELLVSEVNLIYTRIFDKNFSFWGTETLITFPALFILFMTLVYSSTNNGSIRTHILYSALIIGIIYILILLSNTNSSQTFLFVSLSYTVGLLLGRVVNRFIKNFRTFGLSI